MKRLTTAALAAFVTITFFTSAAFAAPKRARRAAAAKCVGAANCRACKNCRYCQHCAKNGGTCGVCRRRKVEPRSWEQANAHATH